MNRLVAAVVAMVCVCAVQTVTAATASAHAELVSSSPGDRSMLTTMPDVVELVFSENVGKPADVVVLGPDGDPVATGDLLVIDDTATLPLEVESAELGTYTISYQVTSADGHPISGFVTFMVHGDGTAVPSASASGTDGGNSGDTDAIVVVALSAALAVALAIALLVVRRLVAGADELPAT